MLNTDMQSKLLLAPATRAEKETETEARRLTAQIDDALAAVARRSSSDAAELEACADRLDRAARDLVVALRELSRERQTALEESR
jgi:hypothetical protein